jgi:salicylate hydroxylase
VRQVTTQPPAADKTRELAEVGGPLGISPQTLRLFGQWGILEQLNAISSATTYFETRDQRGELEQITDGANECRSGQLDGSDAGVREVITDKQQRFSGHIGQGI